METAAVLNGWLFFSTVPIIIAAAGQAVGGGLSQLQCLLFHIADMAVYPADVDTVFVPVSNAAIGTFPIDNGGFLVYTCGVVAAVAGEDGFAGFGNHVRLDPEAAAFTMGIAERILVAHVGKSIAAIEVRGIVRNWLFHIFIGPERTPERAFP